MGDARRPVASRDLRRSLWLAWIRILGGISLIVGGFVVFGVAQSHVDWLSAHGTRTPAVVVGTDPDCGSEDVPHIDVAFTEFQGVRMTDNLATGGTGCSDFHIGQKVWIDVDPSNPSDAELSGGNADIGAPGWIAFGLVLFGIGTSWKGWRELLRVRRTVRNSLDDIAPPKSRLAAAMLAIFLGWLGIHRFYLGFTGIGMLMLLLTVLTVGLLAPFVAVWGIVEGILILKGTRSYSHDARGRTLRPRIQKGVGRGIANGG